MVTKKGTTAKTTTRRAPARRAAASTGRRHKKSDMSYIPSAAATVGLVMANKDIVRRAIDKVSADGLQAIPNLVLSKSSDYKWLRQQVIKPEQLVKDAVGLAGGYVAGEIAKKYAPGVIKRPMGKLAKKIPKVI